jgi:hypothetical protein
MAAFPIPPPPAAQQPQQDATAYSTRIPIVGQEQQPGPDARQMAGQGLQLMNGEVQSMIESAKKLATVGEKMLPAIVGDLSKLTEILVSMKKQVAEAVQAHQGTAGAQPPPPAASSPTDVPMAA